MISSNNPPAQHNIDQSQEAEIELLDIVNFLADSWKKLAAAALAGALLGLGFWLLVTPYQASINLRNNEGLGILSIKSLQATLPNLASEILEKKQAPEGELVLYRSMSRPEFWTKILIPVFSLTKADIKDLGAEAKDTNNPILFLVIKGFGTSKDSATQNAASIAQFFREGAVYMAIRDLFTTQQSEFLGSQARIQSKINAALIELDYQKGRLKSLEELSRRFPVESRTSIQAFDPKDSGAKYLPINTQIIAINTDINNNNETVSRLKDEQTRQDQIKRWLELSSPLIERNYNGLELNKELLALEEKFRGEIKSADPKAYVFVDSLRANLLSYEARFRWGLVQDGATAAKKSSMLEFTAGGLAGSLLLMLLFLLGQRVLVSKRATTPNEK